MSEHIHDLLGVGIGPFNLGLACLAEPLDLDAVFLDARDDFAWHHGLMLEDATIQVPFLADLVTLADPTSPYSFLSYLKEIGRLYPFYIREDFQPLRAEYDAYCRWAAGRLESLRWGRKVVDVGRVRDATTAPDDPVYRVTAITSEGTENYLARHLVLGIGTRPWSPVEVADLDGGGVVALHAADYLYRRDELLDTESVTVVGSGQSAAEIYHDLLEASGRTGPRVDWLTRSPRFFPMEYTKLTLEMTSPEYIDHFHHLPAADRDRLLHEQRSLYKGIDAELINRIHELLYRRAAHGWENGLLVAATVLDDADRAGAPTSRAGARREGVRLDLHCADTGRAWSHHTSGLVMATGYRPTTPRFLDGIADEIDRDAPVRDATGREWPGRFRVARDHTVDRAHSRVHVQNAEEHTHGLTAPDLGMCAMRNSIILRTITGREVYPVENAIAFQDFGVPATHDRPIPRPQEAR